MSSDITHETLRVHARPGNGLRAAPLRRSNVDLNNISQKASSGLARQFRVGTHSSTINLTRGKIRTEE